MVLNINWWNYVIEMYEQIVFNCSRACSGTYVPCHQEPPQTHWLQWIGYTNNCHYFTVLVPSWALIQRHRSNPAKRHALLCLVDRMLHLLKVVCAWSILIASKHGKHLAYYVLPYMNDLGTEKLRVTQYHSLRKQLWTFKFLSCISECCNRTWYEVWMGGIEMKLLSSTLPKMSLPIPILLSWKISIPISISTFHPFLALLDSVSRAMDISDTTSSGDIRS